MGGTRQGWSASTPRGMPVGGGSALRLYAGEVPRRCRTACAYRYARVTLRVLSRQCTTVGWHRRWSPWHLLGAGPSHKRHTYTLNLTDSLFLTCRASSSHVGRASGNTLLTALRNRWDERPNVGGARRRARLRHARQRGLGTLCKPPGTVALRVHTPRLQLLRVIPSRALATMTGWHRPWSPWHFLGSSLSQTKHTHTCNLTDSAYLTCRASPSHVGRV